MSNNVLKAFAKCYLNGAFITPFAAALQAGDFIKFSLGFNEGVIAGYLQAASESKIRTDALEAEVAKLQQKISTMETA